MAVTTTLAIKLKFNQLKKDFAYTFKVNDTFYWSSAEQTIYHRTIKNAVDLSLLMHELAHAELNHTDFDYDIELLKIEAEAWQYAAQRLAKKYGIQIDESLIQDSLDTYRLWIHKRSSCPNCMQNGIQTNQNTYSCLNCRCVWRVNNALFCRLKRTKLLDRNQI